MKTSLRKTLITTTAATLSLVSVGMIAVVAYLQLNLSKSQLESDEALITEALESKGKILSSSHALALRGFVEANAISDVRDMVTRAVEEDQSVVYGLFLDADLNPWAYQAPNSADGTGAWEALGVSEEFLETETGYRKLQSFEQEIWEFSQKVELEEEIVGTIRYGLSTEPMRLELDSARSESQKALQRTLFILVLLGGAMLLLGTFITLRQATRITKPLGVLTDAAKSISSGQETVMVDVRSGDDLEVLANSFNQLVSDLAASYEDLESLNRDLEHKVEERTLDLKQKTVDVENMLKNLQQGILTITSGQRIHHEYSAYLEKILETHEIAGNGLPDVLLNSTSLGVDAVDRIDVALSNMLGKPSINFILNSHLLPSEFEKRFGDDRVKILEVEWNAISDESGETEKMMLTLRDVTELRSLQKAMGEQQRQLEIVGQVLAVGGSDFEGFMKGSLAFVERNRVLLTSDELNDDGVGELFRNMHTIKGNARTYQFNFLNDILHESETSYKKFRDGDEDTPSQEQLLEELDGVAHALGEYQEVYEGKLKGAAAQSTGIPESLVDAFERLSSALLSEDGLSDTAKGALKDIQRTIAGKSVDEVLKNPIQGAIELADELGKEPPIFDVSDPALRIPSKTSELLQNVLVHVFRNSVDHGLESGTERSKAGKDPTGRITVEAQSDDTTLTISVWDDGRGLDLQRLRNKYAELHGDEAAQNATSDAVAELIFDSGMSTAQELTDISGRGVGMDAVRSFVSAEGGSVSLALDAQEPSQDFCAFKLKLEIPISFQV
ncbi:MAG: ATP-binding protein [Myxococcota bacterium]|nr:ATP-binding protein [Myxococcota bacterium]